MAARLRWIMAARLRWLIFKTRQVHWPQKNFTTTARWHGMAAASFGSDPFNSAKLDSTPGSSLPSLLSSTGSFKTRASQWSSSGSGSGSGWLWPWDYPNFPWECKTIPTGSCYWKWWQYIMAIVVTVFIACCGSCITATCAYCFCPGCYKKRKPRSRSAVKSQDGHHHHHHRHERQVDDELEDEEDETDSSEDLEDDPSHRHQKSSHSPTRPGGYTPATHGVPMSMHHPQHRY